MLCTLTRGEDTALWADDHWRLVADGRRNPVNEEFFSHKRSLTAEYHNTGASVRARTEGTATACYQLARHAVRSVSGCVIRSRWTPAVPVGRRCGSQIRVTRPARLCCDGAYGPAHGFAACVPRVPRRKSTTRRSRSAHCRRFTRRIRNDDRGTCATSSTSVAAVDARARQPSSGTVCRRCVGAACSGCRRRPDGDVTPCHSSNGATAARGSGRRRANLTEELE